MTESHAQTAASPAAAPAPTPLRWGALPRPIVALAPMDGVTDSAFRRVVRRLHPGVILFSEFTSADGFLRSAKVRARLDFHPEEHPYFVQLFGSDPEHFAEAARQLEQQGVMGIDINMGCPAKKIVASQHGSGLMRDVDGACRIVERVAAACALPVSVKTRLGWSNAENLIPFAQALEGAGAQLITIHGRTYDQHFHGPADWSPIYALKRALRVPLLGNGDVRDHDDGLARLGNLDGFMVGRAAIGDPWVFLPGAAPGRHPGWADKSRVMAMHLGFALETKPVRAAVLEFRKHIAEYVRGFDDAKALRRELMATTDVDAVFRAIESLAALEGGSRQPAPDAAPRPEPGAGLAKAS
jgi:nifR3 family TIM-barrel protein